MLYGFATLLLVLIAAMVVVWRRMIWMPGRRCRGPVSLEAEELPVCARLEQDLTALAHDIGERHVTHRYSELVEAAQFIERQLQQAGYETRRQEFSVQDRCVWNVEAQRVGTRRPEQVIIVGAHYDTVPDSPGANDNGSAVVANLALARAFADLQPQRSIRFVFFVNEEWPYYMTDAMGSLRYAVRCRRAEEQVLGMLALETIGCYLDAPGSQRYPHSWLGWLYPTTGNFVAVVGDVRSRRLVQQVVRGLRRVPLRSEGIAAPRWLKDIFRSDHAAFWHCGYPALMVTDTANFRYRHYHTAQDTVDKINFRTLARVVSGLVESLRELAGEA